MAQCTLEFYTYDGYGGRNIWFTAYLGRTRAITSGTYLYPYRYVIVTGVNADVVCSGLFTGDIRRGLLVMFKDLLVQARTDYPCLLHHFAPLPVAGFFDVALGGPLFSVTVETGFGSSVGLSALRNEVQAEQFSATAICPDEFRRLPITRVYEEAVRHLVRFQPLLGNAYFKPLNHAKCRHCGDYILSYSHYDCISCKCGAIMLDGGFDYVRMGFKKRSDVINLGPTLEGVD